MSPLLPIVLLAAQVAVVPAEPPAPVRVVEGKPFVVDRGGDGPAAAIVDAQVEVIEGGDLATGIADAVKRAIGGAVPGGVAVAPAFEARTIVAGEPLVEGKPLTVRIDGDGKQGKTLQLRVVGENVRVEAGAPGDAAAGRKVPYIGVVTSPLTPGVRAQTDLGEEVGLSVDSVAPDSPAAKAGLERFDILARYDDQILCAPVQLSALVKRTGTGNSAKLAVIRRGKEIPIEVTVGEHAVAQVTVTGTVTNVEGLPGGMMAPAVVVGRAIGGDDVGEGVIALSRLRALAGGADGATPGTMMRVPAGVPAVPGVAGPVTAQRNQRFVFVNPATAQQSQSMSVFSDDQGQVIHRDNDGVRTITILDAAGKQQYAGPWGGEGDLEKVPAELRGRLEKVRALPEATEATPN